MNLEENVPIKTKKSPVVIIGNVLASIAALAAITLLVINIISFLDTVNYYLAQGYPTTEVYKQLIPSQLFPGVFEPIAVYGGIAFLLFYAGIINQKVSKCLTFLTETEVSDDVVEDEEASESNVID